MNKWGDEERHMFSFMSGLGRRHELVVVCVSRCPRGKTPFITLPFQGPFLLGQLQ